MIVRQIAGSKISYDPFLLLLGNKMCGHVQR